MKKGKTGNSHKGTYVPPAPSSEAIAAQNEKIQNAADSTLASATILRFVFPHIIAGSPDARIYATSFVAQALSPADETTGQEAGCLHSHADRYIGMQIDTNPIGYLALSVFLEEVHVAEVHTLYPEVVTEHAGRIAA